MKATGRVNSPPRRNRPPNVSRIPAMPASVVIGAVPPPGMMAAGNANTLAVPTCMNRKAATILRMLRRYGAQVDHLATTLASDTVRPPEVEFVVRESGLLSIVGRRSHGAGGGALQKERALAGVARERGGALELRARLAEAAKLEEQVTPNARQEVVGLERGFRRQRIGDLEPRCRPECHPDRDGAIQLHDGGRCELGEPIVERHDARPVRLFRRAGPRMTPGDRCP